MDSSESLASCGLTETLRQHDQRSPTSDFASTSDPAPASVHERLPSSNDLVWLEAIFGDPERGQFCRIGFDLLMFVRLQRFPELHAALWSFVIKHNLENFAMLLPSNGSVLLSALQSGNDAIIRCIAFNAIAAYSSTYSQPMYSIIAFESTVVCSIHAIKKEQMLRASRAFHQIISVSGATPPI